MANYTMEIRQIENNLLYGSVFSFDYDFYSDNMSDKKEFEQLFIEYYYFREIGFETPERFKLKLQAKLNLIMPYYRQLAMTEWYKVKTAEQMMTSKNLKEVTEHTQSIDASSKTESTGSDSQKVTDESTNHQTSSNTVNSTNQQTTTTSNLSDGVSSVSLDSGYLTSVSKTEGQNNQTDNGSQTLEATNTSQSSSNNSQMITGSNGQTMIESVTFSSVGDVGVQTPAYAIEQWRKVLININQMIINDCEDLFMKIY